MGTENQNRVKWARKTVEAFPAQADDLETTIKDLITDLRHLCWAENIPHFNMLCKDAIRVAEDEKADDE